MLNPGYSRSAFWLQGSVVNLGKESVTRWLSVGIVRLEDMRFYAMPAGSTQPSGTLLARHTVPLKRLPIVSETSVFPLSLAPGERLTFLLRVETRSPVSIVPQLWHADDFRIAESHNTMVAMLLAGSMISIERYTFVLGIARRDTVLVLLALTTVTQIAQDMAFQGFLYRYLLGVADRRRATWRRQRAALPALILARLRSAALAASDHQRSACPRTGSPTRRWDGAQTSPCC